MNDIPWWQKAGIGALGGFGLALLKLIDAKFYIAMATSIEAQAAYLTYFAYMFLGSLAAVFLADHELSAPKIRRSAFILGLLAPSVLLAIANQPFRAVPDKMDTGKPIPQLSLLPFSSAHAQENVKPSASENVPEFILDSARLEARVVVDLPRSALEPSYSDAFQAALGRKDLKDQYIYVVGSTTDKNKALDTATKMNTVLSSSTSKNPLLKSKVVQVQGQGSYFVIIGGIVDRVKALQYKADANAMATKILVGDVRINDLSISDSKKIASLLADAPIVTTKSLAAQ